MINRRDCRLDRHRLCVIAATDRERTKTKTRFTCLTGRSISDLPAEVVDAAQIRTLYRIEEEARHLDATARVALREAREASAIWQEMKTRALELQPRVLPKSKMGDALQYSLNDYDALVGYLRDGRFQIDNNLVENSVRPTAVGRRRWLLIGHPDAGWRSAVIYSILVSCRRRGINPDAYLTDVLQRLPSTKITDIVALLPANWKPASPKPT